MVDLQRYRATSAYISFPFAYKHHICRVLLFQNKTSQHWATKSDETSWSRRLAFYCTRISHLRLFVNKIKKENSDNSINLKFPWCFPLSYNSFNLKKLVFAIFIKFLFFHQMIVLQKLWKILFITSKKLFSFLRYSIFCISVLLSFPTCQPLP